MVQYNASFKLNAITFKRIEDYCLKQNKRCFLLSCFYPTPSSNPKCLDAIYRISLLYGWYWRRFMFCKLQIEMQDLIGKDDGGSIWTITFCMQLVLSTLQIPSYILFHLIIIKTLRSHSDYYFTLQMRLSWEMIKVGFKP